MELQLNYSAAEGYRSSSQIARVVTEEWVEKKAYCPRYGKKIIKQI